MQNKRHNPATNSIISPKNKAKVIKLEDFCSGKEEYFSLELAVVLCWYFLTSLGTPTGRVGLSKKTLQKVPFSDNCYHFAPKWSQGKKVGRFFLSRKEFKATKPKVLRFWKEYFPPQSEAIQKDFSEWVFFAFFFTAVQKSPRGGFSRPILEVTHLRGNKQC